MGSASPGWIFSSRIELDLGSGEYMKGSGLGLLELVGGIECSKDRSAGCELLMVGALVLLGLA